VQALTGPRRFAGALRRAIETGERIELSALALYEWVRGPRSAQELIVQEALFPAEPAAVFGAREAAIAASLYRRVRKPRGREIDLAIAACAIARDASLWTLNPRDFSDIPDLKIYEAI
jgi:predicted nucleic acid-binding protein